MNVYHSKYIGKLLPMEQYFSRIAKMAFVFILFETLNKIFVCVCVFFALSIKYMESKEWGDFLLDLNIS